MNTEIEKIFNNDWQKKKIRNFQPLLVWSPINARSKLKQLIHSASYRLDIYALSLTDYQLIGSLAQAARRGVAVNILLSKQNTKHLKKTIAYLRRHNVTIVIIAHPQIHAKVILVDYGDKDEKAYLGSTNLTKESLDKNRELGVIIKNPMILRVLQERFEKDMMKTKNPALQPRRIF